MKIALLSKFPPEECGIGIYSQNLCGSLKQNGMEVVRIGTKGSDAEYKINFSSIFLKEKIRKIIAMEKADILHIQYIPPYYSRAMLNQNLVRALKQKIPVVVTLHEVQYDSNGIRNKALRLIERQILKKADAVIVHSPLQRKYLTEEGHENVENVLMGVNPKNAKARRNKNLLCFGIVSREKGHKYLIKAMRLLPEYNLTIAGKPADSKYEDELLGEIKELGLKNVKTDFRWVEEQAKENYYMESSMLVLPYTWGPYTSAVAHDAMAYNMPTIVTRVGAVWEIVDIFRTGAVVPPCEPEKIKEAVESVEKGYEQYIRNIQHYRKLADWKRIGSVYKEIYSKLIAKVDKC